MRQSGILKRVEEKIHPSPAKRVREGGPNKPGVDATQEEFLHPPGLLLPGEDEALRFPGLHGDDETAIIGEATAGDIFQGELLRHE